jgi:hypothetical protein
MLYPSFVPAENISHLAYQLFPNAFQVPDGINSCALLGVLAPFGAAKVNLRINDHISATAAFELWLILKKFHSFAAPGAFDLEYIFRFPKSLVLSWASEHICTSFFIFNQLLVPMRES